MAQDPYGFPETAATGSSSDAVNAMWYGIASAILTAVGICACYVPYFIGAPLGFLAAWKGMKAMEGAVDARDKAMATAGMVSGLIGGIISGLFSLFILMYVAFLLLYFVVIIIFVGVAGASGGLQ